MGSAMSLDNRVAKARARLERTVASAEARAAALEGAREPLREAKRSTDASAALAEQCVDEHFQRLQQRKQELEHGVHAVRKAACQPITDVALGQRLLRAYHSAVVTRNMTVVVVGGMGAGNAGKLDSLECLKLDGSVWEQGLAMPTARSSCGACAIGNRVVVVGGRTSLNASTDAVEAVDTVQGACTKLPSLPVKLSACAVASVGHGVVVTGGWDGSHLNNAWVLQVNPASRGSDSNGDGDGGDGGGVGQQKQHQWKALPSMAQARKFHGAAGGGGCVFVCGGIDVHGALDSCEMLQMGKAAGAWQPLPSLPGPSFLVSCCYGGGNLFALGGTGSIVFRLNVRGGKWEEAARIHGWNLRGCALVCVGRRVLVLGGINERSGSSRDFCEGWDF